MRGESSRQREDSRLQSENFGFELADENDYARFQVLCELPHNQCRFQDMEAMTRMGIADNVLALANNVGLTPLFQANHLAYRALTLEFMSTVVVERPNGVPRGMRFQLGGHWHSMHVNVLDQILQCLAHGAYTGNHDINTHELWGQIAPRDDGAYEDFNAMLAKASSIRNPMIRYLHRLISTGLFNRKDDGTFQANELHLIWAAFNQVPQSLGCYMLDHFHFQSRAATKIRVGAMITPISHHVNIPINEPPISLDIYLDKKALKQRHMIHHDRNPRAWPWLLHQANGKWTFSLPNIELTNVMGENCMSRQKMNTPEHFALMRRVSGRDQRGANVGGDGDGDEDEDEAYKHGGVPPHQEAAQAPFHM